MAQGRKRIEGQGVELWQEGRKIATSIHRRAAARWPATAGSIAAHCPKGQWLTTHAVI